MLQRVPTKSLLYVCLSVFLRNGSLGFSDFWQDDKQLEYLKTGRALFSMEIHFWPNLSKKGLNWTENVFWISWKNYSLVFLENNLKLKLILLLIFHHQSHIWENSGSQVMNQNTDSQSSEKHGEWSWVFAYR